jgi:hypothetical protein
MVGVSVSRCNRHAPLECHALLLLVMLGFSHHHWTSGPCGWKPIRVSESGMTVYIDRTTVQRERYFVTMAGEVEKTFG